MKKSEITKDVMNNNCPEDLGFKRSYECGDECTECWKQAMEENEFDNEDTKHDAVNHPSHYCREGAIECFEEFEVIYGIEAAIHACMFNIHKYRYRAADKNGQQDLEKSDWYSKKLKELKERAKTERYSKGFL